MPIDGLIASEEKPSNTEVLGLLMDPEKRQFISKLTMANIKALLQKSYLLERINNPKKPAIEILQNKFDEYLILLCSLKGLRASEISETLKHIIDDANKEDMKSIADQIKK